MIRERKNQILENVSQSIREIVAKISNDVFNDLQEIRLRSERPLTAQNRDGLRFLRKDGTLSIGVANTYKATRKDIEDTLELMSESSVYAFLDEIKQGFITIRGGHRIGICGRVVSGELVGGESGEIINIRDISGINIRIAKEVIGSADRLIKRIYNGLIKNTLIISPPQCGKTTILRDIARILGRDIKVGLVDERGEIAAVYKGVAQHDVGIHTDVLDLCPKHIGMIMLLRSMSPDVIITDELATKNDLAAVSQVINSGVKIIASAHGFGLSDVGERLDLSVSRFERIVVLGKRNGPGTIEEIIDI